MAVQADNRCINLQQYPIALLTLDMTRALAYEAGAGGPSVSHGYRTVLIRASHTFTRVNAVKTLLLFQ